MDLWGPITQTGTGGNPAPSSMQAYTRKYAYDKMGNITQLKQTAGTTFTRNFHYDTISSNNILHSIKKADDITNYSNFTYDVNGNKVTAGTNRNYVWDYGDQLKAFLDQTGTAEPSVYAQYLYSGGQRVKKLVRNSGGSIETTVYIDGVFEHRYDSSANAQSVVHIGGAATVRKGYAFDNMPSTTYQLSNHLGSINFRLDSNGAIVDREEHYPFGDSSVRTWGAKRYRYVGKEKDAESGLYYYGARYYAAWTCRFISVDPLARSYAHLTSYNYSSNEPVNQKDIDGMQNEDEGRTEKTTGENQTNTGNSNATSNPSFPSLGLEPNGIPGTESLEVHPTESMKSPVKKNPEEIPGYFLYKDAGLAEAGMLSTNMDNYVKDPALLNYLSPKVESKKESASGQKENAKAATEKKNTMTLSNEGALFIIGGEGGFHAKIYDANNPEREVKFDDEGRIIGSGDWTIGYGHQITEAEMANKTFGRDGISKEEGLELYKQDLSRFIEHANENLKVRLEQHQFDALISFTFQQGQNGESAIGLYALLNDSKFDDAVTYIENKGNLISRRKAESVLMDKSIYLPPAFYQDSSWYIYISKPDYNRLKNPINN